MTDYSIECVSDFLDLHVRRPSAKLFCLCLMFAYERMYTQFNEATLYLILSFTESIFIYNSYFNWCLSGKPVQVYFLKQSEWKFFNKNIHKRETVYCHGFDENESVANNFRIKCLKIIDLLILVQHLQSYFKMIINWISSIYISSFVSSGIYFNKGIRFIVSSHSVHHN